nr:hypothetical protein [Nitrosopumilus oxyclinae]
MIKSESFSAISADTVETSPSKIVNDSGIIVCDSRLPFRYNESSVPLITATKCDQSCTSVVPEIFVHVIPSKIANVETFSGE